MLLPLLIAMFGGGVPVLAENPSQTAPVGAMRKVTLRVEKMACSACAARVTKVLRQLDGVKDAKVDLKAKGAVVDYDPARVSPQQLIDAVNDAGFRASLPAKG
jgi:copper chaperone CopZ